MHTTAAAANTATHTLAWGLAHLAKVTYHQPTDSYIARCPDCDWATEPSRSTRELHAAADQHYAAGLAR